MQIAARAMQVQSHIWLLYHLFSIAGIPGAFTLFYIYEKKEEEIDHVLQDIVLFTWKLKSDISGKIFSSTKKDR